MTQGELKTFIEGAFPNAQIQLQDLTGSGDHWQVLVVSGDFEGKTRVEQHQMVMEPLRERLHSNEIHALALKTYTPEKWEKLQNS
jgi:acid stress-induced BolA-like protein IbaG/YrbA